MKQTIRRIHLPAAQAAVQAAMAAKTADASERVLRAALAAEVALPA